jgi:hypothetical protein
VDTSPAAEVITLPVAAIVSLLQETVPTTAPAESLLSSLNLPLPHPIDNLQLSPTALSVEPEVVLQDTTQMVSRAAITDRLAYTSMDAVEIAVSNEASEVLSRSQLKTDFGVKAAAKPKPEPPAWYQAQAISVLTSVQAMCQRRDELRSEFPLSPDFSVLCPLSGNIKKPTISAYLASDQTLHIFSLRLFPRSLSAFGFSGSSSSNSFIIPCPYNTTWGSDEPVPHMTVPTDRFVYRAFAATPSRVNFALCAQDRCNTCGATFLHSNTVVLSRLPRFAAKCMGISLEGNDGDPGLIVSECVVNEARANERMRQGALNTEKKCRESVGDGAV